MLKEGYAVMMYGLAVLVLERPFPNLVENRVNSRPNPRRTDEVGEVFEQNYSCPKSHHGGTAKRPQRGD